MAAHLEPSESAVGVEIGPGGLRTAVDLLEIGAAQASGASAEPEDLDPDEAGDDDASTRMDRAGPIEVSPGTRIDLGDGVTIQVVDVRLAGQRSVVDLAVLVDEVAILLPGPGATSSRWAEVAPEAVTVAVLPASAVSWARTLPPRNWLLLVGEAGLERARGQSDVPFLDRRELGSVEVSVHGGTVAVRTERCPGGRECAVALPPPTLRSLVFNARPADSAAQARSPVQSGQVGDDRRSIR